MNKKKISSRHSLFFRILPFALIVLLGFASYANSLNGAFLFDDEVLIENNVFIKDLSKAGQFFVSGIGTGAGAGFESFYRPLLMLSYSLNYALAGLDVRIYHLTNLLLHVMAALVFYAAAGLILRNRAAALAAALIFVVHPVHTEAVSYISGRADMLAAVFILLAFVLYMKQIQEGVTLTKAVLCIGALAAALLSKEYALFFPLLILAYHGVFRFKANWSLLTGVGFVIGGYMLFRMLFLQTTLPASAGALDDLGGRLPGVFAALFSYVKLLILPYPLHMEYGLKIFAWSDPAVIAGVIIVITAAAWVYINRQNKVLVFASLWFVLMLLPVLNLYKINYYMAEHFLYLPSAGFFMAAAFYWQNAYERRDARPFAIALLVLVLAVFIVLTIKQNDHWKVPRALFTHTLKYAPDSYRSYNNLARIDEKEGRIEEALSNYSKAIALNSDDHLAYNNRGALYASKGDYARALEDFAKTMELRADYAPVYDNWGHVHDMKGDRLSALKGYTKAIELNPYYALAYNNRGSLYIEMGQYDRAIDDLSKAVLFNPQLASAYNNRANAYAAMKDYARAISDYTQAMTINPSKEIYRRNLERVHELYVSSAVSF